MFPAIDRLSLSPAGGIKVKEPLISNCITLDTIEGLPASDIVAEYCRDGIVSANDYVSMMLRIAWECYKSGRTKVSTLEVAGDDVFNLDMFSSFTKDTWLDSRSDRGTFVLQHGDSGPCNIIVDEETFGVRTFIDGNGAEWSLNSCSSRQRGLQAGP